MTTDHDERMLLADDDSGAALAFRNMAEKTEARCRLNVELYAAVGETAPPFVQQSLLRAELERRQLDRIVLRHKARELDEALLAAGWASEWESRVIMFNIMTPVVAAA